ncbi:MAG TPA: EamA family transporter [Gaiellaceae bacterium]|nr:EamA family transporter [Gaiellaceae bacterium]
MAGPLLALAASLSWGLGDFVAGLASRRLRLLTVLVVSQGAGLASIAVVVLVRGEGAPPTRYLGYAALAGLAGAVGLAALYRGLAVGSMSVVAPISATAAVVPVVAGLVTGERPSSLQGAGIALALAGVALASRDPGSRGRRGGVAGGVGLALVAALSFGLLLVGLGAASEGDALWATLAMRTASFGALAAATLALRRPPSLRGSDLPALAAVGLLDTAGNALFALASTRSLLSVAAVLAQVYPVVTVILARVLLGERIARAQQAGVAVALVGVALVTAG